MRYEMNRGRSTIILDTQTGYITGDTYNMRDVIKSEFPAKWEAAAKAWHVADLEGEINCQIDRLRRVYRLCEVESPAATTVRDAFVGRIAGICPRCGTYCYGDCSVR